MNDQADKKYWISSVLRCLIQNNNQIELEKLQEKVEEEYKRKYPDFETEIKRYPSLFRLEESNPAEEDDEEEGVLGNTIVSGRSDVRLCEKHCSKAGSCKSPECESLHMCRFFILNECNFNNCHFGHDIGSVHNVHVLEMHLLHALGRQDVGYLLRDVRNRNETTIPKICNFYNVKTGCSREYCQFLHLCKKFVEEDCKFGHGCKRSHNWFDEQLLQIFKKYGIRENDINRVMKLFRKTTGKSMPTNVAMKNSEMEEIYTRSRHQNENVVGSDAAVGLDMHEDSRHVIIDKIYHNKPRYLCGAPSDKESQEDKIHQSHMMQGTHFDDISSDEEAINVCNPKQTYKNGCDPKTKSVCPVETVDNQNGKKESCTKIPIVYTETIKPEDKPMNFPGITTGYQHHTFDFSDQKSIQTPTTSKPSKRLCMPKTDQNEDLIVSSEIINYIIDSIDTMEQCSGKKKIKSYQDDAANKRSEQTFQDVSVPLFQITTCNTFEDAPLIGGEYTQNAIDNSPKTSKADNGTAHVVNNETNSSGGLNETDTALGYRHNSSQEREDMLVEYFMSKPNSSSGDRLPNVTEIYSSTLTTGINECDQDEFKVRRVTLDDEKSQWMFYSVNTWASLPLAPEVQDTLERSYQLFQKARQCLRETLGSR